MKQIILALFLLSGTISAAVRPVYLTINHTQLGQPFDINRVVKSPDGSYDVRVTMLRYYLSAIKVIHDGGQVASAIETTLLVDVTAPTRFSIGSHDVENIERIEFSIGIPQFLNHNDPSLYPIGHPLGHQDPSMHWGWAAGYRFVTFEGLAGRNETPSTIFQVHALGDELYTTTSVATAGMNAESSVEVQINAEVMNLLAGIDATFGQITHGSTDEAVTVMQNFGSRVFSAVVTSVNEDREIQFSVSPQPASETVQIMASDIVGSTMTVADVTGRVLLERSIQEPSTAIDIRSLPTGSYTVVMHREGQIVARKPLHVVR